MLTEHQLNEDILKTTMLIQEKYPELLKYVGEMPVTIPDTNNPEINIKNLKDYAASLNTLLQQYINNHQ
jgi:hypothetical protein